MGSKLMARTALYERVWATPIKQLAAEFDLSDTSLRTLCKRHDIPMPVRGYWAKVRAGHKVKVPKLPRPHDDSAVTFPNAFRRSLIAQARQDTSHARKQTLLARSTIEVREAEVPLDLRHCHPLVSKTRAFFAQAEAELKRVNKENSSARRTAEPRLVSTWRSRLINGRLAPDVPGTLRVVATLQNIDWILRFHEGLIRALMKHGCEVRPDKVRTGHAEVHRNGETVGLSFAEEYETHPLKDPERWWNTKTFVALDSYKLKLDRPFGADKVWRATRERLAEMLPSIAHETSALLVAQIEIRRVRAAEEAVRQAEAEQRAKESRAWFAEQQRIADRREARADQVDRAMSALEAHGEHEAVQRFLDLVESRALQTDEALVVWLRLVRGSLTDPLDLLINQLRAEGANEKRPLWWPEG